MNPATQHSDHPHRRSQRGLATLDILLGMAIFALVIVIGVQNFNTFRGRSYVTQASSDVKQVASSLEAAHTKDEKYPDTVAADASGLSGVNLTRGSKIAGYAVTGGNFKACVLSGAKTTSPVAYAIYDSARGTVIEAGKGTSATACNGTGIDTPATPSSPRVANVVATSTPGQTSASIAWDPLVGGGPYQVYLDGASSPAWTGPGTSTTLPSLAEGPHQVTVTATLDGSPTEPSNAATFTIYCDNNAVRCAHPVEIAGAGAQWQSVDYTNQNATTEAGETDFPGKSMWWTFKAPSSGSVRVTLTPATDGSGPYTDASIYVWKSTATTISGVQAGQKWGDYRTTSITFPAIKDETYKIRTGDVYGAVGKFRLRVETGPANDAVSDAVSIPAIPSDGSWTGTDTSNEIATVEPGETDFPNRSMWWTYTPTVSGTVKVTLVPATDGTGPYVDPSIYIWKSAGTTVSAINTGQKWGDYRTVTASFPATKGETYKIRTGSVYNQFGKYRLRLETSAPNDDLAEAMNVPTLLSGQSWTSPDTSNAIAMKEPGEGSFPERSMWWTFTAATSGNVRVTLIPATDGSGPYPQASLYAWQSSSTDPATVNAATRYGDYFVTTITFPVTGGNIYKIRTGSVYVQNFGKYRIKIDAL